MELLLLVWRQYRWPFISVMALSLASAALGIGLIAFINQRLIETVDTTLMVLPEFLALLLPTGLNRVRAPFCLSPAQRIYQTYSGHAG